MEISYRQQALQGASGVELIIALYDGAIRFLYRAIQSIDEADELGRRIAVKRSVDIIMYLQARLRTDIGGKPAASLSDFYAAMFTMTLEASSVASKDQFAEVIACLRNVREAWLVVARDPDTQKILPRELRSQEERYAGVARSAATLPTSSTDSSASRWSA
jgi:flagellar secretion chaperone FliS